MHELSCIVHTDKHSFKVLSSSNGPKRKQGGKLPPHFNSTLMEIPPPRKGQGSRTGGDLPNYCTKWCTYVFTFTIIRFCTYDLKARLKIRYYWCEGLPLIKPLSIWGFIFIRRPLYCKLRPRLADSDENVIEFRARNSCGTRGERTLCQFLAL